MSGPRRSEQLDRAATTWAGIGGLGCVFATGLPGLTGSIAAAVWVMFVVIASNRALRREQDRHRLQQLHGLLDADLAVEEPEILARLEHQLLVARRTPDNVAEIVHELRTPMTIVLSSIELITEGYARTDEERDELLQHVRSACHHSLFLVNDLLDEAALEANSLRVELQECDAREVLDDARRVLLPLVESRSSEIHLEPIDEALVFAGDQRRTLQILFNLVSNSAKYSPADTSIWLRAYEDPEARQLVIEVEDEGFGVPADRRESLFQPFERMHEGEVPHVDGTGLGLPLCRRLAEAMGGSTGYRPRTGADGSLFWVRLPLAAVAVSADESSSRA